MTPGDPHVRVCIFASGSALTRHCALSGKSGCTSLNRAAWPPRHSAPNTTCPCPPSMPGNAACTLLQLCQHLRRCRPCPPTALHSYQALARVHSHRTRPTHRHRHPRAARLRSGLRSLPGRVFGRCPRGEPLSRRQTLVLSDSRRHASGVRWFACPGEQSSPRGSLFGSSVHLPKQARRTRSRRTASLTNGVCE